MVLQIRIEYPCQSPVAINAIDIQAPAIDPRLVNAVTSRIRPARLVQNNFAESSFKNSVKSSPVGSLTFICAYPANHPAAKAGFREVIGDANAAVNMATGCPPANIQNNAAPMKLLGKTIAQLRGGFTASAGSIVAVSDNSYRPAYFDSSAWKYVHDNSSV